MRPGGGGCALFALRFGCGRVREKDGGLGEVSDGWFMVQGGFRNRGMSWLKHKTDNILQPWIIIDTIHNSFLPNPPSSSFH